MIGDPALLVLPLNATQEQYEATRELMHLNDPLSAQLYSYLSDMVHGDFGDSFYYRQSALPLVLERLPATYYLTLTTFLLVLIASFGIAFVVSWMRSALVDRLLTLGTFVSISIAEFWLGLMLILLFAVKMHWLPSSGFEGAKFVLLPAIALAFKPTGRVASILWTSINEEMRKNYILTARGKGLGEAQILIKHALRNAISAGITVLSDEMTWIFSGSIVIETVFGWPGIGSFMMLAVSRRDLAVIQAAVFVISMHVLLINLIVDLLYVRIDPRIRT
jgi:peptide/nickel transport system permease protein